MSKNLKSGPLGELHQAESDKIFANWKTSGLLEGLKTYDIEGIVIGDERARECSQYLEAGARLIDHTENFEVFYEEQAAFLLLPAIRRMYSACRGCSEDGQFYHQISSNPELQEKMLELFDVNKLLYKLDRFLSAMNLVKLLIQNLDFEATVLALFCQNEVAEIYNRINKPDLEFKCNVSIGNSHEFEKGIEEISFDVRKEFNQLTKEEEASICIIADSDIYYDNKLIIAIGQKVPFFSEIQAWSGEKQLAPRNIFKAVVDLRQNGTDFKPEKLSNKPHSSGCQFTLELTYGI